MQAFRDVFVSGVAPDGALNALPSIKLVTGKTKIVKVCRVFRHLEKCIADNMLGTASYPYASTCAASPNCIVA